MEYADLLNDIKQNGILQCLYINYGNVILDGHHRFKAEKELGIKEVEVSIPELIDISKYEYLISVALNRRQLSEVVKKRFQGSLLETSREIQCELSGFCLHSSIRWSFLHFGHCTRPYG